MLLTITVLRVDFGPMKHHEMNAIAGDLFTTPGRPYEDNEEEIIKENSHVLDLVLPVVVLIASCIVAILCGCIRKFERIGRSGTWWKRDARIYFCLLYAA